MVTGRTYRLLLLILFMSISVSSYGQTDVFATIKLNRNEVYPQQPIKATITVFTATWFTQPLDFDNIQVSNAFVIPFKRTLSSMRKVNGQQYASLEFYYLIYPYQAGKYAVSPINIIAESPPKNDYKGVKVSLKTEEKLFTVQEVPDGLSQSDWIVAKNMTLTDSWDRSLQGLKVGDVLERTITINAQGTLPNFIPGLEFEPLEFATLYPKSPVIEDKRSQKGVNGMRQERLVYLLEEEGDFIVPEVEVSWWNPFTQRLYSRSIPEQAVTVAPNPDLGMVKTLKDSLGLVSSDTAIDAEEDEVLFFGYSIEEAIMIALGLLLLSIVLVRSISRFLNYRLRKRMLYRRSEAYYFSRISGAKTDADSLIHLTYEWWDTFRLQHHLSPSLTSNIRDQAFATAWQTLLSSKTIPKDYLEKMSELRHNLLHSSQTTEHSLSNLQKSYA